MTTTSYALVTEIDDLNPIEGDLRVDGVELGRVEGADAVAQEIQVRLRWWLGEWFLDQRQGTPYLEEVLEKGVSAATVRAVLRRQIELVPDVARITLLEVELDPTTRRAMVDFEVETVDGETAEGSTGVGS